MNNEWISTATPPEHDDLVLLAIPSLVKSDTMLYRILGYYNKKCRFVIEDGGQFIPEPSHWYKLPEAPK